MVKKQSEIVKNTEKPENFETHTSSTPSRGTKQKKPTSKATEEDGIRKHVRRSNTTLE